MIELPEAITIAGQITSELAGKRITSCQRGMSPHKFAWFGPMEKDEYEATMVGLTVGEARGEGPSILVDMGPVYVLVFGEGGERILYHEPGAKLPKKHQLLLGFNDGSQLTVTVSGWGRLELLRQDKIAEHPYLGKPFVSPLSDAFTDEYFLGLFGAPEEERKKSVKFFLISEPGVRGIGNGVLQDILYHAGIHPRRPVAEMSDVEKRDLYRSIRETLQEMVDKGGRDSDYDLYNRPGGYARILHSKSAGTPCPQCGTLIEKQQYLGGAIYFCPSCQV